MPRTFATLEVSQRTYDEIARLLRAAGYGHAFVVGSGEPPTIDMHGIGLVRKADLAPHPHWPFPSAQDEQAQDRVLGPHPIASAVEMARQEYAKALYDGSDLFEMPVHKRLLTEARAIVLQHRRGSISLVQRHLAIGYNAAARIMEKLELEGVVKRSTEHGGYDLVEGAK